MEDGRANIGFGCVDSFCLLQCEVADKRALTLSSILDNYFGQLH
jgi:hypothetical protein